MKYKVTVPPTAQMGSFTCIATRSPMKTLEENALWDYNSSRAHDGLLPLSRMPAGTLYNPIADSVLLACKVETITETPEGIVATVNVSPIFAAALNKTRHP